MELEAGDILITDVTRDEDLRTIVPGDFGEWPHPLSSYMIFRTVAEDGSEATIFRPNFKVLRMVDPE